MLWSFVYLCLLRILDLVVLARRQEADKDLPSQEAGKTNSAGSNRSARLAQSS